MFAPVKLDDLLYFLPISAPVTQNDMYTISSNVDVNNTKEAIQAEQVKPTCTIVALLNIYLHAANAENNNSSANDSFALNK